MDFLPTNNNDEIPWDLISAALEGNLTGEEEARWQQWLSSSQDNLKKYEQLRGLWKKGLPDYEFFQQVDIKAAKSSLQERIQRKDDISMHAPFKISMRQWMAAAAVMALVAGVGWWYFTGKVAVTSYATTDNERKQVALPDGSQVSLGPATEIQVPRDFNKASRTVVLTRGEASFDVKHQVQTPFVVSVEAASVKDIGTSFTVQKAGDSVQVVVITGKVAFIKNETGEERELSGGMSLSFHTRDKQFGEIIHTTKPGGDDGLGVPLGDIIGIMGKKYGKQIRLEDSSLAKKRLTIYLEQESFDNAMQIICASLNLQYSIQGNTYVLKE